MEAKVVVVSVPNQRFVTHKVPLAIFYTVSFMTLKNKVRKFQHPLRIFSDKASKILQDAYNFLRRRKKLTHKFHLKRLFVLFLSPLYIIRASS